MADTGRTPEEELERTTDEFEERIDTLGDHIGEAQKLADEQQARAGGTEGPVDDPGARTDLPGSPDSEEGAGEHTLSGQEDPEADEDEGDEPGA